MFSWNILLLDTDCHAIKDSEGELLNPPRAFHIADNVWLGAYTKVLKGATIPEGSIIASGSIVSSQLTEGNSIYVGNNKVKSDVYWSRQPL